MSSTASQSASAEKAYSTAFTALDATQIGRAVVDQLLGPRARRRVHVIVRRKEGKETYFYLLNAEAVLKRLRNHTEQELARLTLKTLLDLHGGGRSPTVTEQEEPSKGAVVVRGSKVLGFFPEDDSRPLAPLSPTSSWPFVSSSPDSSQDDSLERVDRTETAGTATKESLTTGTPTSEPRVLEDEIQRRSAARSHESPDSQRSLSRTETRHFGFQPSVGGAGIDLEKLTREFGRREKFSIDDSDLADFRVRSDPIPYPTPALAATAPVQATPPSPAQTPPRFFNARTPDRVALNAQTYVVVQVAGEAAQGISGTATANAPIGDFIGELTIDVHAPGLKANGPTTLTLQVPANGNSASLRFGLLAHRPGIQQVDVMAWNGSAQVAGVTLQIAVETDAATVGANQAAGDMDMREPEAGEYTLDVAMDLDTKRYRFQLRSDRKDVWPPMYSEPLLNARQQTYEATIANLNAQARNLYGLSKEDQAVWLRGMGNLLFEQLVPDKLKALLIEHKSNIRVLNILSEADPTPWELLFLADPDTGDGDFLAASTTVARWRYGAGPSRTLKRANKVLVLPADAPPEAKTELHRLQSLLGGANTIDDLTSLNSLLAMGAFDLLHFAAHNVNVPNAQGGAYIPFGKQRWDLAFMAAVPQNKFKSRAPLVFMNACTTSGTTTLYTELASWADRFLRCGSGAFIGTLWEVRDSSARQFSVTFYDELMQGQTLGEAIQAARAKLRAANPGDPTPLAYTLYGNPLARLEQT